MTARRYMPALLLLFVRFLPVVSMFETRHDEHLEKSS